MGLLNYLVNIFRESTDTNPATKSSKDGGQTAETGADNQVDDLPILEYAGETFHCQVEESPNGQFQAAYADGRSGPDGPRHGAVFLFEDGQQIVPKQIERPNAVAVSNTGIVVVADWEFGWGDGDLSGTVHIFDRSGTTLVEESFDSNLGPCAVTVDGRYAAVTTLNPDCSTYVFDVNAGERLARHENEGGNKQKLVFEEMESGWELGLANATRDKPTYAIDLTGEVVWRSSEDNRRGDVDDIIEKLQQGTSERTATSDLCAVARQSPSEITPHLQALLDMLEDGVFETISGKGGEPSVSADSVFTAVAKNDPAAYEPHLQRLFENVRGETNQAAAVVSTGILAELAKQGLGALGSKDNAIVALLEHSTLDVRKRGLTILEADVGRMYDQSPNLAERLSDLLHAEDDLAMLRDTTSVLTSLVEERPGAAIHLESTVPRLTELLTVGDPEYQYGDIETYDYKDQTHYETNHLHRSVPQLIAALAPTYAAELADAIPTLLQMVQQPGQRNTSLRSASLQGLVSIAEQSQSKGRSLLEAEFGLITTLLDHDDDRVQKGAVELLVILDTERAKAELRACQGGKDTELASVAARGLNMLEAAVTLSPETTTLSVSGEDFIARQQRRCEIQRAYEFLQTAESARKQLFIEKVYTGDWDGTEEQWWRMVRGGLKSIETVELSGNTYSYTG